MLQNLKEYRFFTWLIVFPFLIQCSQPDSTDNNSKKEAFPKDSLELTQIKETTPPKETKKLPSWPLNAKSETGKRYPFDQGQKIPEFASFRENLYQAVLQKDLIFLRSVIHEEIKFSFGAENGKADFLKTWQLDSDPKISDFWSELETVLSLGGAFFDETENSFYAPYIFMLEDIDDPYTQAVIIGEKVRLREEPSSKAKIINSLNWNLVEFVNQDEYTEETINGETHFWQKVKTTNNETGFVFGKYVRSPIDFRVGFSKNEGKWMITLFIAGD